MLKKVYTSASVIAASLSSEAKPLAKQSNVT
jgi:hypothetical protein